MPSKSSRPLVGLAITLVALALVPGSLSATSAQSADPLDVAVSYLDTNAKQFDVTSADVADVAVTSQYRSSHNGVTHVNLNQRLDGLEVFGAHVTVNVASDGRVIFAAGSLVPLSAPSGGVSLKATDAVVAAADALDLGETSDVRVISEEGGAAQATVVSGAGVSAGTIGARLGWQPTAAGLRKAWQMVIDHSSSADLWNATIDAETGALLASDNWTDYDNVDALRSRLQRSGVARQLAPFAATILPPSTVADGSRYRVYQVPNESPNDGPRTVVMNPADALASPFGWHDTNGLPGAEFTTTQGTAAHAYLDQDTSDSADFGSSPDGGPSLNFDFTVDLTQHAQSYRDAAVANLFYMNSAFHDLLSRRGMDEAAGNFQANNYGRGGLGGDYVRAEAADGNGTNNANFGTPTEPTTGTGVPRMQMYLWPGNQFGAQNQVVVDGLGSFDAGWSRFGATPTVTGTAGRLYDVVNGCAAADYAGNPGGTWVAIATGGNTGCQNVDKARQAGAAGAAGIVLASGTTLATLTGSQATAVPNIAVASVTAATGTAIRAAITAGPTTGTVRKHPSHPGIRDGDFENGIIIHEYGHGVSNRLTGGPAVNCLSGNEQAGEGWSDYLALTTLLDPALDNPNQPRGMGPYALFQADRHGAGIRPRPYTRDMSIQPFTYDSIKTGGWLTGSSLALPHGLGHGWAATLWDMTWDLIDKHGFNPQIYGAWNSGGNTRSQQYVIDGLKMQGCGPGLVVARAAIIAAADLLSEGEDTCTLWASFARRGLGYSAVQGTTGRDDNSEAFDTHPDCLDGFIAGIKEDGTLNTLIAGNTRAMTFTAKKDQGADVLASPPYSRMVDCNTLATVDPAAVFITPRPIPVTAQMPTGASFTNFGVKYTFPWQTLPEWDGTCREFVLTRADGVQHRAYFLFSKARSFPVSGRVRNADGTPAAGATVTLKGTQSPLTATTDASGLYEFESILAGTYAATASLSGCEVQAKQVEVKRKTALDFTLGPSTDSFGYVCSVQQAAFQEAATALTLTGDDASATLTLPFTFKYYGTDYTTAWVSTNGVLNFQGANAEEDNVAIPATANPDAAVYAFWDDLIVDAAASVRTELLGTAPNRRFVVEWRNVHFFGDTTRRVDFNVVLNEGGRIVSQTRNVADDGRERGDSATFGIENQDGTVGIRFGFNQPRLRPGAAINTIQYQPPA